MCGQRLRVLLPARNGHSTAATVMEQYQFINELPSLWKNEWQTQEIDRIAFRWKSEYFV